MTEEDKQPEADDMEQTTPEEDPGATYIDEGATIQVDPTQVRNVSHANTDKLLEEARRQERPVTGADETAAGPEKAPLNLRAGMDAPPREIPVRLGSYVIEGTLGRGGMGVVYKARQEDLNRTVALKLLLQGEHASDRIKHRFVTEAKAIAKLRHPNIVAIHEVGEFDGKLFFSMDFIDGLPLSKFVMKANITSSAVIADLCVRICEAVQYAHEQGVIHRDLKPDNILMDVTGEPVITDFGLAKDMEDSSMFSMTGEIIGTPAFTSPEQACGKLSDTDERSDVYSLGAILYWLLTRKEPFHGNTLVDTLALVASEETPIVQVMNPSVESDLSAICLKAMEKEMHKRYQSAQELADDLRRFLDGVPVEAKPWTWQRGAKRFVVRHRKSIAAVATAAVAIVIAAILAVGLFASTYLDLVGKQLVSENPTVRAEATTSLAREIAAPSQLDPDLQPDALVMLLGMLADPDPEVTTAVLEFLAEQGGTSWIARSLDEEHEKLLTTIAGSNDDPANRNLAISSIGIIRRPSFVTYLIGRLREPQAPVRLLIVRSLGNQKSSKAISPLIRLASLDPVCRAEAQAALDKIYTEGMISPISTQDSMLRGNLKIMSDAILKQQQRQEQVLDMYTGSKKPRSTSRFGQYEEAMASPDKALRMKAVYELGITGDKDGAPLLLRAFGDSDQDVRGAAALAISHIKYGDRSKELTGRLKSGEPAIRGNAALALGFIGDKAMVDHVLVALATEPDLLAKKLMIRGLAELGSRDAVPGLKQAAESDPRVTSDVRNALALLR